MVEDDNELLGYATVIKEALEAVTHDDSMAENEKVQVLYATTSMAFAKVKEVIVNGGKSGPLITFYLSSCNVENGVQLGGYKILTLDQNTQYVQERAPVIANLKYTVTINCINERQADLLQSQVMLAMPFNRPYWTKFNGQFVTMVADGFENLSSVDVGDSKDKISRRQLGITIDRAYLQHPYTVTEKDTLQKKIELRLNSEELLK